jgi:hypothetical protein
VVPTGRADRLLPAHRQPEHPDARRHVRASLQEVEGAGHVVVSFPAEVHGAPRAAPVPPCIGQEDAVAVPSERSPVVEHR